LSRHGSAAVTAVFLALLGWLVIETEGGSDLRPPELPGGPPEAPHEQPITTGARCEQRGPA
jgi:hypothetical protein